MGHELSLLPPHASAVESAAPSAFAAPAEPGAGDAVVAVPPPAQDPPRLPYVPISAPYRVWDAHELKLEAGPGGANKDTTE